MSRAASVTLAIAVILALYALLRAVQQWDPALMSSSVQAEGEPTIAAENAMMMARERGETCWQLHVDRITLRRMPGSELTDFHAADFHGIRHGTVYDQGRHVATFSAAMASYERSMKRLEIRKDIVFRTIDGEAFQSDRCVWTEADEFARFPEGARAAIAESAVTARTMLYSTRTRLIECPDGAEATLKNQTIAARTLTWDIPDQKVRCTGPITGNRGAASFIASYAELDLKHHTLRINKGAIDLRIDGGEVMPP